MSAQTLDGDLLLLIANLRILLLLRSDLDACGGSSGSLVLAVSLLLRIPESSRDINLSRERSGILVERNWSGG